MNVVDFDNRSVFSLPEFLSCLCSDFGSIELQGYYISYIIKRSFFFSRLEFTTKLLDHEGKPASIDVERRIMPIVINHVRSLSVDYIGQPLAHVYFSFVPDGAASIRWSSPIVDLNYNEEELLLRMHKKHRNVVKRAAKEEIRVVFDESVACVHKVLADTMSRQARSVVPFDVLNQMKELNDNVMFVSCYVGDDIQGVAVIPYDNRVGYYLYGGSSAHVITGALNYMHYQIMLKLKSLDLKFYDLMGYRLDGTNDDKILGIQKFKTRFGVELQEGITWKFIIRPKKYKLQVLLHKMIGFYRKKPYQGDLIDRGLYD